MRWEHVRVGSSIREAAQPQRERRAQPTSERHDAARPGFSLGRWHHDFTLRDDAIAPGEVDIASAQRSRLRRSQSGIEAK
jgi:hypothetical protein